MFQGQKSFGPFSSEWLEASKVQDIVRDRVNTYYKTRTFNNPMMNPDAEPSINDMKKERASVLLLSTRVPISIAVAVRR